MKSFLLAVAASSLLIVVVLPARAADPAASSDGAAIYEKACAKCHSSVIGGLFSGAPKIGSADWSARVAAAGSTDAMFASVKNGKGKMSPQGGASGLTEADLRAATDYLLAKAPHQ